MLNQDDKEQITIRGQVASFTWEDGQPSRPLCGLEDCECPTHEETPPKRGSYITIRADDEEHEVRLGEALLVIGAPNTSANLPDVEAAARAGWHFDADVSRMFGKPYAGTFDDLPDWAKDTHRDKARAMLDAAHATPSTVLPQADQPWLGLLTSDKGGSATREWRGVAASEDEAIEQAMNDNPGWSVHTFGPDVNVGVVLPQVDETRLAEAIARFYDEAAMDSPQDYPLQYEEAMQYGRGTARVVAEWLRGGGR